MSLFKSCAATHSHLQCHLDPRPPVHSAEKQPEKADHLSEITQFIYALWCSLLKSNLLSWAIRLVFATFKILKSGIGIAFKNSRFSNECENILTLPCIVFSYKKIRPPSCCLRLPHVGTFLIQAILSKTTVKIWYL